MLGFHPGARGRGAQNYAEGGLVRGLVRRVMGIPEPTPDPAPAAAAPAAPAPAPAPAPAKAISDYSGMGAMKRREAAAGLKNGGMVRGPGTGTSDSIATEVPEGSYIMPADSTAAIGPDALEGMGAEGFHPGKREQVPVNLSNGEFELPPEQVHAVGVQALEQMKGATHTPAPEAPKQYFADGGLVEDEEKKKRGVYGDAAAAAATPGTQQPAATGFRPQYETTPTPSSWKAPGTRGMNDVMGDAINTVSQAGQPRVLPTMSGAAPTGNAGIQYAPGPVPPKAQATGLNLDGPRVLPTMNGAAPTGTPGITYERGFAPASARGPGPSALGNSFGDAAAASSSPGTVQQPATASAPTAPTAPTAPAAPSAPLDPQAAADRAAIVGGAKSFAGGAVDTMVGNSPIGAAAADLATMIPRGIAGAWDTAVVRPVRAAGFALPYASPGLTPDGAPDMNSATPFTDRLNKRNADAQKAAAPPIPSQGQVRAVDGNSANQAAIAAAPVAAAAAAAPEDGGSANYMQPVDPAAAAAPAAPAATGFTPGSTPNADAVIAASNRLNQGAGIIGPADYANRNAGFNNEAALRTAAARGSWSPRNGFQSDTGAIQAAELPMRQATELEQTAMRTQSAENISAQNNAGELARTGVRDAGDTSRANIRAGSDAARTAVDSGRLDLERTSQGFQVDAARRMQGLQDRYLASKDPAEQAALARQIREFQGKDAPARFKVASGGQTTDQNGAPIKVPDRVFNEQTGQFVDGSAPATNPSTRPAGTKSTVNGKTAVWDGKKWVPQ